MRYYPICLDIRDRPCLVVGGGQVGTRKVKTLLACGARVTVVSPKATPELEALAARERIVLKRRTYRDIDQQGVFLTIGATNDAALNGRIHRDAEQAGRLCNIADQPRLCNFVLPSVIRQGDLMITISTSGQSPAFAKFLRRQMQDRFGPEYGLLLDLMGSIRRRLLRDEHAPEAHKPLFERLIAGGLLDMIRLNQHARIDSLLAEVLGEGFSYEVLLAQSAVDTAADESNVDKT